MALKMADVKQAYRYKILKCMANSPFPSSAMREAVYISMEHPGKKMLLYTFVIYAIPGEEALEEEKNQTLWNPSFIYAVDNLDGLTMILV